MKTTGTTLLLALLCSLSITTVRGGTEGDKNETLAKYTPEIYDSLVSSWYSRNVVSSFDTFFNDFIDLSDDSTAVVSDVPDSVYSSRLKMLLSPIQLPYNQIIKRYLVVYTTTRKSTMERILGLSQYYFPMIEEELCKAGLPLELRMLPVIESALCPTAVSRAGATGLWQFMYGTGRTYGLEITSFVDQRRDPVIATQAACRYLKDLFDLYNDWTLAIAAYNCGPGNINKALKRAGGEAKSYWDIYPYLPRETRGYIPSFIAATYAYTFHKQHQMEPVSPPIPLSTDTIHISRVMHLEQITSTLETPIEVLRSLNPQYKLDIIPALDKTYTLTLPQYDVARYLDREAEILAKDTLYLAQYLKPSNLDATKKEFSLTSQTYRVKSGDTLGAIARRHGVTVSQLVKWNRLKSSKAILRIGQRLEIYR
ncbi:lytic transglycosylase domain-containing protein [Gallalistipes aquisgranensis]|uniref:lytic transglycosylase domain-containing protein n=1 Tax=Gallalistipes aquisgranensis TaxID=2779358 RepID=UPI001CF900A5|nr:lytic transglycosylase domain-containing protein [Gallalistipes aquisgranensis]MBE5033434.1 transglycosylase SLT domain-containing protein [Gallalistipes aquisgranensis]